jgi:ketosteroid isomerase-like protein
VNTATPKDVVVRYVNAVADGDLDTITASFADDATWTYPGDVPLTGTWTGRDTIINDFLGGATNGLFDPTEPPTIELTNVIADGDRVVAEWTARGLAKTNKRYDNRCLGVVTIRDGKIASVREYTDTQHVERVLFTSEPGPVGTTPSDRSP